MKYKMIFLVLDLIKIICTVYLSNLSNVEGRLLLYVKLDVDDDGVYADGLSNTVLFRDELKRSNPLGLLDEELELDV